ncbi:MAG: IcmT/TraK family protein [Rhodobacteraceae bacterium]|nr:IcmT/TraK family protein [Paracoccaceae bacterium]
MNDEINYWRETQREPRFFFVDARIFPFVLLATLHIRLWTILLLAFTTILFVCLEARGIRPGRLHRHLLTAFRGPHVHARHPSKYRRYCNPGTKDPTLLTSILFRTQRP